MFKNLRDAPFILVPQYFGCTVFDRRTSKYMPFDHTTTELLRASQHVAFLELAQQLAPEQRRAARQFYLRFYDVGMFSLHGHFRGMVLDTAPAEDHLTGPLAVHLEVVAACNLTCTHCFAGELPRKERRLGMEHLDRLFASMARMGSFRLGLTGGEPLLRRDLFEIIDRASNYGLHPCLTSNGLLITEEIAREFGKRDLIWLNISLDGASAASNDRVRGAGTFERVIEKIKILRKHAPFTIAFTIMQTNAHEVEACAKLAEELGANTAVFRPMYPVGSSIHHLDELMPSFEQYNNALSTLHQQAADSQVIDPFSPMMRTESQAVTQLNYGCGAANSVCSISVSGQVNPCSFLGDAFVSGNISEQSLEEIWHQGHVFREMRALPGGSNETFSGGCRARSLVFNGSVNAPDPWMQGHHKQRQQQTITLYEPGSTIEISA